MNQREKLATFLRDGRLKINNRSEGSIKPLLSNVKN
ncbi:MULTISPECIES: hypothetical protein [Paenibacillus]|nr:MULTISPECIES: hypothetical protein [Paenibacillus]